MYDNLPEPSLKRILPDQIEKHIQRLGWVYKAEFSGRYKIYDLPDVPTSQVIVPLHQDYADYAELVGRAIQVIAEATRRPTDDVLYELTSAAMDLISYTVDGPQTLYHAIPLEDGVNLYTAALSAIKAAVHDLLAPTRYHPRMTRKEATLLLSHCRMGQTQKGSYISNIYCPVDIDAQLRTSQTGTLFDEADLPAKNFARRVTARMMTSINHAVQAIEADQISELIPLPEHEYSSQLISSNFFEALGMMEQSDKQAEVEIKVDWSPALLPEPGTPSKIVLQPEYFPYFRELASRLRPRKTPQTEQITGRVASLSGEPGEEILMSGEIIIDGETSDGEIVKVRVYLDERNYEIACDAHKLAQLVSITGVLHRRARVHELYDAYGFYVKAPRGSAFEAMRRKVSRERVNTVEKSA